MAKGPKKPNCLAGLAGPGPYPQYSPPAPRPRRTPDAIAADAVAHRQYERTAKTLWCLGGAEIKRAGTGAWEMTDSHWEYAHALTRDDLRRLRDALTQELGDV